MSESVCVCVLHNISLIFHKALMVEDYPGKLF